MRSFKVDSRSKFLLILTIVPVSPLTSLILLRTQRKSMTAPHTLSSVQLALICNYLVTLLGVTCLMNQIQFVYISQRLQSAFAALNLSWTSQVSVSFKVKIIVLCQQIFIYSMCMYNVTNHSIRVLNYSLTFL